MCHSLTCSEGTVGGMRRYLDAAESFKYASGFINDGADSGCLGTLGVELILHQGDKLLSCLVRAIFIQDMVEIQEKCAQILDLLTALFYYRG